MKIKWANNDYKNNVWDKGHMAPAAAFTDTKEKLKTTFSYLNCSLQFDKLNRGAWRELEAQERAWAKKYGTLKVRVVLHFEQNHLVLETGGHVPNGYWKYITFPNGRKECFYFPSHAVSVQHAHASCGTHTHKHTLSL